MFDKFAKNFGTAIFILSVCLRVTSFRPVYESELKNLTDDSSRNATSLSTNPMTLRGTRNDLERYTESRRDPRRVDSIESPLNYFIDKENNEVENCSSHSIDDFPTDLFTPEQRKHGAALLHAFFGFYCFLITAYACNDYLLPALDLICADINISPNVAGATFLATASCFPELFVSVVGTFLTESDLGIGTVVGGAVFNTFATPAFGALSAAQGIQLEWTVLSRDCIIYIISVLVLVLVMWDGLVTWYEAMSLIIMFAAYFTLLFLNDTLSRCVHRIKARLRRNSGLSPDREGCNPEHEIMPVGSFKPFVHGELVTEYRNSLKITKKLKTIENLNGQLSVVEELEEYIEPECALAMRPSGSILNKVWFLLTWPIKICLFLTIPDSRYKKLRNWYPLSFIMCIMWIAVSSYLVSWMMTVVGDTLGIADSIMGITFLSAGGNMPELVSIVILSRKGNGDMAMSNTLGANTLDVLLCLGLPWTIRTLMTGKNVEIESGALAYSVLSIIICVVGFFAVTAYYKFTLNKKVGVACLLMYALFLTVSILMESNVFFPVNLPMCKS